MRKASVTDSAEAAVKGSSNTAGGEGMGAQEPEGYTLLEEWEGGAGLGGIQSWKSDGGEEERQFPRVLLFEKHQIFPFSSSLPPSTPPFCP